MLKNVLPVTRRKTLSGVVLPKEINNTLLAEKYRGCLLGSLLGDCLGAPYEFNIHASKVQLQQYFDELNDPSVESPLKSYTDDSAMTKSVAKSLICCRGFDPLDMAKRFTEEYFKEPDRGYGRKVIDVFRKLRAENFKDPYGPAKEQFKGAGSHANGAAMRVAPIALFYRNRFADVIEKAKLSAMITHANKNGINGAVLQAVAVHQGLTMDPEEGLNALDFTNKLLKIMMFVENNKNGQEPDESNPYQKQLNIIRDFLENKPNPTDEEVQNQLGNGAEALFSVPTALFCFLRSLSCISEIKTENPLQRTIQYAISLGGDTDTIAAMAGAIAGAFYGESVVNESLKTHCESSEDILNLADYLFELAVSSTS